MSPLDPRLSPADAYYFIAHEHMVGRRRLHPRIIGIGLGAALLGELILAGSLTVDDRGVHALRPAPPRDPLLHSTLALLLAQPQHRDPATWLAFLAEEAADRVAQRLQLSRRLEVIRQRRLIGIRRVLVPVDVNEAAWESVRLERLLNTETPMCQADCFLVGLVWVTGLIPHVLWDPEISVVGRAILPDVVAALHPALYALVKQCETAVGHAVLAPR
ncbi:hypothetical protein GCM10010399_57160 [Dactylosporangium fulvum]|uniref:GPP34 family phosphoprotein n=1 Tax=Dactylosporangium fulvum TaxID=53359 RepID=A0ABY5VVI4_9ACTN|nr:GPP34 family phosphoprotein [Dactylosporangium fulvum]UWP80821.1 GPP34 family phosphoprotein [Dactylosporangium fulvum]